MQRASPRPSVSPQRADVKAIVDDADARTAVLRNQVIGTQVNDITRAPTRLFESEMGNLVDGRDAGEVSRRRRRVHELGRTPPGPPLHPAERGRSPGRDHLGRGLRRPAVRQPHDDPHAHGRPAPGGVPERVHPVLPGRASPGGTGRFPQISGLKVQFHCNGIVPVIDGMWKAPDGVGGTLTPIGPADSVRIVTNDFLYGGGDGYTVFASGHECGAAGRRPAPGHDRLHHGEFAGRSGRGRAHRRPVGGPRRLESKRAGPRGPALTFPGRAPGVQRAEGRSETEGLVSSVSRRSGRA